MWVMRKEVSPDRNKRLSGHDRSRTGRTFLYVALTSSARSPQSDPDTYFREQQSTAGMYGHCTFDPPGVTAVHSSSAR